MSTNKVSYQNSNKYDALLTSLYTILAYVLLFSVGLLQYVLVAFLKSSLGSDNYFNNALILFLVYIILTGILIFINRQIFKDDFNDFKQNHRYDIVIIGFLALYVLSMIGSITVNLVGEIANSYRLFFFNERIATTSSNQSTIVGLVNSKGLVLTVLTACIFGPIVEELVFRKSIFNLFKDESICFVLSSIFFALIHVTSSFGEYNITSLMLMTIDYLIPACTFGYIYLKGNKNVLYTIMIHIIYNTLAMILMFV